MIDSDKISSRSLVTTTSDLTTFSERVVVLR